ncbi:UDP-N-acetylmuramoyl-tripeptide--D-alanyl-D-alanine ligase [Falsiroseomonas bella]|uniref:UDP-N-acetylmuramoyl-tripeptide--D-alanyl-D-alanine ligase n=1 Tax=Falsiroseomonas bella TaxID=2184016 RepID=A0A317FGV6_9PROT|nr:UDP-N-acetylmuramoyl-tripeptide--D-alanyl-D-alanine ligase [Falsiroseomonas bella]PWS37179.1 UDP-N-acetylmuramoyl-tripeptide--D-alanyl-D-alanine ligase [Falsiroseomonas bella]
MSALWTAAELRSATGGTLAFEIAASGVSIDTRSLQPGDLFVALRDARDGHDFVAEALARGAVAAMVDHDPPGVPADAPLLRVPDTLAGLRALGAAARARSGARFIGVTGSVGKTTTKEMLRAACSALGPTHAAAASYNNHWGVPLTLARLPRDAAFAIIEIGMNSRGEIAPLSRLARPHVVVITTIGTSHIGRLGSQAAIAEEKADILAGLEPGGAAVLPADTPFLPRLLERAKDARAKVLTFGESARAEIQLTDYVAEPERGTARLLMDGLPLSVHLGAPGMHLALNACAAIAAVHAMGGDAVVAAEALSGFDVGAGRGARVRLALPGGEALLLDDSYNASAASIRAALSVLRVQPASRRIVVLGDMLELGAGGPAMHAELAPDVAAAADLVYACGPLMRHLFEALPQGKRGAHAPDSAALAPMVAAALRPGDAVVVKGSLGSRMALVVEALKALDGKAGAQGAGVVP